MVVVMVAFVVVVVVMVMETEEAMAALQTQSLFQWLKVLIKPTASRSKDIPLSQSINSEMDSSPVLLRAKTLEFTLANNSY